MFVHVLFETSFHESLVAWGVSGGSYQLEIGKFNLGYKIQYEINVLLIAICVVCFRIWHDCIGIL